ncbi:hypothetical protein, partial [Neisseria subflava]|uniref:hypothetical protein n=1 Tax=Neisseria subflava TaxID=28449 RepID=UPI001F2DE706
LPAISHKTYSVIHDRFAFASTPVSDRMPRSLETKAALEVNAGLLCLAGVPVLATQTRRRSTLFKTF